MKAHLGNPTISVNLCAVLLFAAFAPAQAASPNQAAEAAHAAQAPRQNLIGAWKFNPGQSDDPAKKLVDDDDIATGETGTSAPLPGQIGGRPNASQNGTNMGAPPPGLGGGMGAPGGMSGMGGVGAGPGAMPMPQTAPSHRWETDKDREKKMAAFLPARSLTIEEKDGEYDLLDDVGRKQVLYTDGRKLRKSKDDKLQEFNARFDAGRLTYEEKRPPHGAITRTFELSPDGRQMIESMEIDNGSITVPMVLKYVYDSAPAGARQ